LGPMPLLIFFQHTNNAYLVDLTQEHCYDCLKNPIPWRDSNPGLLILKRMRCRLRHAARVYFRLFVEQSATIECSHQPHPPKRKSFTAIPSTTKILLSLFVQRNINEVT
jgi:hypothetical protein